MSIVTCSVEDCERTSKKMVFGLCTPHYNQTRPRCTTDGCTNPRAYKNGMCTTHNYRTKKYGDPHYSGKGKHHKVQYTADGLRICKACGEGKPLTEYHADSGGTDGYRAQCKPCRLTYMQGYHEVNGDRRREYITERRKTHGDHVRALDNARYERDKDKRIVLATEHSHLRRARLKEVEHERGITVPALRKIHGDSCCYCGVEMSFTRGKRGTIAPDRATLEHILPISRGGSHTWDNMALACHRCNTSKNAKTLDEWSPNNGYITDGNNSLEACSRASHTPSETHGNYTLF